MTEAFKLTKDLHHFGKLTQVLIGERNVGNGIVWFFIRVVLFFKYNDRGTVSKFITAHHLNVHLDGSPAYALVDALIFIKRLRAGVDEVFQRPPSQAVTQAI